MSDKNMHITLSELREARGQCEFLDDVAAPIKWVMDSIRANITDPNIWFSRTYSGSGRVIYVMNAGQQVATLSTFAPKGQKRDEVQADIESGLIKNKRSPHNTKRSSSRKVVDTFHQYIKTYTTEESIAKWAHDVWLERYRAFHNIVSDSAPVQSSKLSRILRDMYHADKFDLIYGLCTGESGKYFTDFKNDYLKLYSAYTDSKADADLLLQEAFVVQELPNDRYWVVRSRKDPSLAHKDTYEQYALSIREYPSTDALPDVIQNKLALMKMGTSDGVPHVGVRNGAYLQRYVFIDENFGDVFDTRIKGKEGGHQLP
jgi:hypothetical protein